MDVQLNNDRSRLKDETSTDVTSNMENCMDVLGPHNNGIETHLTINSSDLSHELKEKLRIACSGNNGGPINGCKTLCNDIKNIDISNINGLSNCHNLEILNSHVDKGLDEDKKENKTDNSREAASLVPENKDDFPPVCNTNSVNDVNITYVGYESEKQMADIMRLIQKDLSEPYSIYTYRYFIHNWPKLCFLAYDNNNCVGAIVCKLDLHKKHSRRGYIAMLAVDEQYRKRKIGSNLVLKAIRAMVQDSADEVVLETEITNKPALRLYENLGFVRDKRLFRYYLNGVDALRLKLWLR